MIADVAFDVPLPHPFSYRVPEGWSVAPGQRVAAPLRGAARVGVVTAVRDGDDPSLKALARVVDAAPLLSPGALALARWIADESLTSLGSTCLALLPPPSRAPAGAAETGAPAPARAGEPRVDLLVGAGREARLLEMLSRAPAALVLTADIESAARWAQRLGRAGDVVRLDSGVAEAERAAAWAALAAGRARVAVGTRSALLAPLPPGAALALVDEHEAAHKPPGPPRMHSRDVVLERTSREGLSASMTSATPSVEMWWRSTVGLAALAPPAAAPWPHVGIADTRGIARREALTPPVARAIRETLAAGRRVFLVVSRLASALGCDECGEILKCRECVIALAYSPAGRTLACRLCSATAPLPETCPGCRGRRLTPFGWGIERVEHAVRRRFAQARIARYDPDAARGAKAEAGRAAAAAADVVVGTRGALRLFGPASLGLAAFVSPDQLLGLPDFRAAERAFALAWAAAERVRPDGAVLIQSQNPTHYAFAAVAKQALETFYAPELKFRAELGYPPFRRLAVVTTGGSDPAAARRLADDVAAALRGGPLTVYPAVPDRRQRSWRVVVKGGPDLPASLADGLRAVVPPRAAGGRGIIDVEVDPVEWRF